MARPFQHPKSGVYYLRRRVPADLQAVVGRKVEKRSLGTKDPVAARRLHAEAIAECERRWTNLRSGLFRPSPRQSAALAGELYRSIVTRHEGGGYSPFFDPQLHAVAVEFVQNTSSEQAHERFLSVFGRDIEAFLIDWGLRMDPSFAGSFHLAVARAVDAAENKAVAEIFEGNFAPDGAAGKFPPVNEVSRDLRNGRTGGEGALRISEIFATYAEASQLAPSTSKRWGLALGHVSSTMGHDDLRRMTADDVSNWIDALRSSKRSERTIRDVHLAALKALLNFLVDARRIDVNVASGLRIKVPKPVVLRSKSLGDGEAKRILEASLAPQPPRIDPKHRAARRWIPWLCAYTGARVNELTQLRAQDIFEESGIAALRITPEAGSVKTRSYRDVPIHPHLVEMGFLEFARRQRSGPLFYDPKPTRSAVTPPYKKLGERLARWVRDIGIDDPNVDPFHGWRHRFKTLGRRYLLRSEVVDAIQGHVPTTEGGAYGEVELQAKYVELLKIPRYDVRPSGSAT